LRREALEVIARLRAAKRLKVLTHNPALGLSVNWHLERFDDVALTGADACRSALPCRAQNGTFTIELTPAAQLCFNNNKVLVRHPKLRLRSDDAAVVDLRRLVLVQRKLRVGHAQLGVDTIGMRVQVRAIEHLRARVMPGCELLACSREIGS